MTRLHAEGGLGRIWVARDGSLDRDVALKELKPHTATDVNAWRRFLREAQVTGQLEHPNIVPVYELNQEREDRAPFYTMRLVKGKTLREAVAEYHDRRRAKRADPLELPRLLQAFVSICQEVSYAHSRGVIHRDLKPDNIILGDFGQVLVLDWGLAKTRRGRIGAEDVAQSVCRTFVRRAGEGEFELADGGALWGLLCAIALTKIREQTRFHLRQKRSVRDERHLDSALCDSSLESGSASPEVGASTPGIRLISARSEMTPAVLNWLARPRPGHYHSCLPRRGVLAHPPPHA